MVQRLTVRFRLHGQLRHSFAEPGVILPHGGEAFAELLVVQPECRHLIRRTRVSLLKNSYFFFESAQALQGTVPVGMKGGKLFTDNVVVFLKRGEVLHDPRTVIANISMAVLENDQVAANRVAVFLSGV